MNAGRRLFALLSFILVSFCCCGSAVSGSGLGAVPSGPYRPPLSYVINLAIIGDSICDGYTTTNPPTTGWANQSAIAAEALGYTVNVTNYCQPSSSSWEFLCSPGLPPCPYSNAFRAGQHNVVFIATGTNNFSGVDIYGTWFHNLSVWTTTALPGTLGSVSAVATGATTTITLGAGVTANRNIGEYIQVVGSGVTGLDGTCAAITNVASTTLTLNIATSGATSSGTAYLCSGAGSSPLNIAFFSPTVAGETGSTLPSWILAGGTTDGTATWGAAENQSATLNNLQADIVTMAGGYSAAGFNVAVATLLPRGAVGQAQTLANQEIQRNAFNTWLLGKVGSSGIKLEIPFYSDPNMSTGGIADTANTLYYNDAVHPSNYGSAYLAQNYGMQAIFDAVHPTIAPGHRPHDSSPLAGLGLVVLGTTWRRRRRANDSVKRAA